MIQMILICEKMQVFFHNAKATVKKTEFRWNSESMHKIWIIYTGIHDKYKKNYFKFKAFLKNFKAFFLIYWPLKIMSKGNVQLSKVNKKN